MDSPDSQSEPIREARSQPTDRPRWLEDEITPLDQRVGRLESNRFYYLMRQAGALWEKQRKKAGQALLHSPFHPLYLLLRGQRHAIPSPAGPSYEQWVAQKESCLPPREWHQTESAEWRFQPAISVLMATFQPKKEWLEKAIASVKAQSYEKWQLCVCDDASVEPWVRQYLDSEAAADSRIRVVYRDSNGGISEALNAAGRLASAEYVTFLDHDDELHPYALHYVVEACQEDAVDLLYSDEDKLDPSGARVGPGLKPDWSPDLLDSCMYFGHLLVTTRKLIDAAGWFRSFCDGAQDYDLALRLVERAHKIRHVRRVLYHWRQHPQSTSLSATAKPYAQEAGRRALAEAVARRQIEATIEDSPIPLVHYIRRPSRQLPVSLIVCSRDPRRMAAFLEGQERTRYSQVELVVVEHVASESAELSRLLDSTRCVRVPYRGLFHFSRMRNLGTAAASSEQLVFVGDDITPVRPEWLEVMEAHLERPEIGVVGGRLLSPSGGLQHGGVVFGILDGAGNPGRGALCSELMPYLELAHNVSAVTGECLGIRRALFQELGSFDPEFPTKYSDLDLCLKVRERGYNILVDPRVEMIHAESGTRPAATTFAERQRLWNRWGHVLSRGDPYYPEAFDRTTEEVRLAVR